MSSPVGLIQDGTYCRHHPRCLTRRPGGNQGPDTKLGLRGRIANPDACPVGVAGDSLTSRRAIALHFRVLMNYQFQPIAENVPIPSPCRFCIMAVSFRDREIMRSVCPTCRNDVYNQSGEGVSVSVPATDKCRLLSHVRYDAERHRFRCPFWTPERREASA